MEPAPVDHTKNGQIPLNLCVNPGVISQFGLETLPPGKRKRELCTPAPTQGHSAGQESFRAAESTGTDRPVSGARTNPAVKQLIYDLINTLDAHPSFKDCGKIKTRKF